MLNVFTLDNGRLKGGLFQDEIESAADLAMDRAARAVTLAGAPVTLRTSVEDNVVVLKVLDNGPGVKEADMVRLFQPFTRGDSARSGRGTGLGLAIVKRIADMHGATITLENRPEGGLAAILKIPYC